MRRNERERRELALLAGGARQRASRGGGSLVGGHEQRPQPGDGIAARGLFRRVAGAQRKLDSIGGRVGRSRRSGRRLTLRALVRADLAQGSQVVDEIDDAGSEANGLQPHPDLGIVVHRLLERRDDGRAHRLPARHEVAGNALRIGEVVAAEPRHDRDDCAREIMEERHVIRAEVRRAELSAHLRLPEVIGHEQRRRRRRMRISARPQDVRIVHGRERRAQRRERALFVIYHRSVLAHPLLTPSALRNRADPTRMW